MARAILITGATGTQGSALIDALLAKPAGPDDFLILAVTRNAGSPAAQRTLAKSPSSIRLVEGDLDDAPALFESARAAAEGLPIWGVFSVQVVLRDGWTPEGEVAQGKAVIDEALKAGTVRHFVFTSVERGGDEASWDAPTPIPQFQPKYHIERHLREATARPGAPDMGWTVLRPVSFMDNLAPRFGGHAYYAMMRGSMPAEKTLQWIAAADIGFIAAEVFRNPEKYRGQALGLATDELTFPQLAELFTKVTGRPFDILGGPQSVFPGFEDGMRWFNEVGYGADVAKIRRLHPGATTMEDWLKKSSYVSAG
jgi:uncharacterized protein YbjT (DUF2867 family)